MAAEISEEDREMLENNFPPPEDEEMSSAPVCTCDLCFFI
jgi:hypothetical protein